MKTELLRRIVRGITRWPVLAGLAFSVGGVTPGWAAGNPEAQQAHASITEYVGPATCIECHRREAEEVHGSVHYQQSGPTPNVTNISGTAGKSENAFNTYCGSIRTSPFFTCAGCHVGNGLPPSREMTAEQLNNIDCLMCHQDDYARVGAPPFEDVPAIGPDGEAITISVPVEVTFHFEPDLAKMTLSILAAARSVHPTTRKTCLRCHAGASGSDGGKRGDISSVTVDPPKSSDIHMSSHGENLNCAACHDAGDHRVRGRGLDLRPNDTPGRATCESCHKARPHEDFSLTRGRSRDLHGTRVACQSCHIPKFAKDLSTELVRDWFHPHFSATACSGRGGWAPGEIRESNVIPSYQWFDGTSQIYVLGQVPELNASGEYAFGVPNGGVASAGAKLYPMKEHRSISAQHKATGQMIPHSTFTFFTTGDFLQAVEAGAAQEGLTGEYALIPVHTYQTINHGVEESKNALRCGDCHSDPGLGGGSPRMNLQADLGYALKGSKARVCTQCHDREDPEGFEKIHKKHVQDKKFDCSVCHNFSRPERGLSFNIGEGGDDDDDDD